jgi:hypothetical protein
VKDAKNLHDLFTKRWQLDKAEIFKFIEETIALLKKELKERKDK